MSKTKRDRLRQQTEVSSKSFPCGGILGKCRNAGVCLFAAVTLLVGLLFLKKGRIFLGNREILSLRQRGIL